MTLQTACCLMEDVIIAQHTTQVGWPFKPLQTSITYQRLHHQPAAAAVIHPSLVLSQSASINCRYMTELLTRGRAAPSDDNSTFRRIIKRQSNCAPSRAIETAVRRYRAGRAERHPSDHPTTPSDNIHHKMSYHGAARAANDIRATVVYIDRQTDGRPATISGLGMSTGTGDKAFHCSRCNSINVTTCCAFRSLYKSPLTVSK